MREELTNVRFRLPLATHNLIKWARGANSNPLSNQMSERRSCFIISYTFWVDLKVKVTTIVAAWLPVCVCRVLHALGRYWFGGSALSAASALCLIRSGDVSITQLILCECPYSIFVLCFTRFETTSLYEVRVRGSTHIEYLHCVFRALRQYHRAKR